MAVAGPLPVEDVLGELAAALDSHGAAVLSAPPGAGKSTRIPLAMLSAPWLAGRRILLLEPRRLAARAVAERMAATLGEAVGATVGYRMRGDTRVTEATRIEVVTEGVLTRLLQSDPALSGVGLVIFDEFHERSLDADLGLAFCLEARAALTPELRLLVMSATLDLDPVAKLLGVGGRPAPMVRSEGRQHPVATKWQPLVGNQRWDVAVARLVARALTETHHGDVLVFLPGAADIRRLSELLAVERNADHDLGDSVVVLALHGGLSWEEQDRALAPDRQGRRKVLLATSIAETSLTIDGVSVVVDAGRSRVPRFDARRGVGRLETVPVSVSSADQRRGRAGRQGPGSCYRLWSEADHASLHAGREGTCGAGGSSAPQRARDRAWDDPARR